MISSICEKAINESINSGVALLKFISANDLGITGGHQSGFYLPKAIYPLFTPFGPERGVNRNHPVQVVWPDGQKTDSIVKWYGQKTRSEYRITGFGRNFVWREQDNLGNLLILIPNSINLFFAFILYTDEDIEEIQASLGIEISDNWVIYQKEKEQIQEETKDDCINRLFSEYISGIEQLPSGNEFSSKSREIVEICIAGFNKKIPDEKIVTWVREEYRLYKMAESKVYHSDIVRPYKLLDDFINIAMKIIQGRKSRAGRSLENHVEFVFTNEKIPFQMRPNLDGTKPDIIIPSKEAYEDVRYPKDKIFIIGIKRTCKDRWRQILREAPKIEKKHILTLQSGISHNQLIEMKNSNVRLIVPKSYQQEYPRDSGIEIVSIKDFIAEVKSIHL